jgi:hypothetical protein
MVLAMAVDRFALLDWLVQREDAEPGVELGGPELMTRAAHLNGDPQYAWAAVARAAAELKRLEWIDWRYEPRPGRTQEIPLHLFNDGDMQPVRGIIVTGLGHNTLAARRRPAPTHQINIIQSEVGQLALGDIANIDLFVILDAAERCLEAIDAPEDAKEEARGVLHRMRETGATIATGAAGSVLATAVRQALGLP